METQGTLFYRRTKRLGGSELNIRRLTEGQSVKCEITGFFDGISKKTGEEYRGFRATDIETGEPFDMFLTGGLEYKLGQLPERGVGQKVEIVYEGEVEAEVKDPKKPNKKIKTKIHDHTVYVLESV